jgi:hypothetical protein
MRAVALLSLRNEGAFLLEWLAHHRVCGFTDFVICSNDCTDGTDRMLDHLDRAGLAVHLPNPGPHPQGPHFAALRRAAQHPAVAAADWVMCLDIDEFVNIHTGDHSIGALLATLPEATAIALTWRLFGNAGVVAHPEAGVLGAFTRAAPAVLWWPWRAMMFKTLYRNDGTYRRPGIHRPRDLAAGRAPPRWFDGSGTKLPESYHAKRLVSEPGRDHFRLAQVNHYALGSVHDFLLKRDRGRANRDEGSDGGTSDLDYWVDRNLCAETDLTIGALAPAREAMLAELRADATLAGLEAAARDWRHARLRTLLADDHWRTLYGRLLMTPPSRILTAPEARALWALAPASGPQP